MQQRIPAVIALALFLINGPAEAHREQGPHGSVIVEVCSDNGGAFPVIPYQDLRQHGTRIIKQYLEARKGERYRIRMRNSTAGRVGLVIAVDGRNIISGERSLLRPDEPMYILNGHGTAEYAGWRTDDDTVHRFYFTDPDDSYSLRTFSDSSALGVIAVAVFREKDGQMHRHQKREQEAAPRAPSASGKAGTAQEDRAGTGFGDSLHAPVIHVAFEPERRPLQKTLVRYEWRETLCRQHILRCGPVLGNRLWDADAYAPFPPGYPSY